MFIECEASHRLPLSGLALATGSSERLGAGPPAPLADAGKMLNSGAAGVGGMPRMVPSGDQVS
jgi:hypothetical protein